ncbi:MAG: amidohydrolase family protein [Pirellulales bacterium]
MTHRRERLQLLGWLIATAMCATVAFGPSAAAPPRSEHRDGLRENTPAVHALTDARIVVAPGRVIEKGTVVIRDGVIEAVGADVTPPDDARIWSQEGKSIYAGLIDAYSEMSGDAAADTPAGYWNNNVTPQVRAAEHFSADNELNRKLRSQGIVARLVAPSANIVKGISALVSTGDENGGRSLLSREAGLHLQLSPVRRSRDSYPNSPMGAVALVRQAFYDADWYGRAWQAYQANSQLPRPETNIALDVLSDVVERHMPVIVDSRDVLYFMRADRLGKEFGLNVVVRGSGREYRRLDAVRESGRVVLVPLNFPQAPNVATPEAAMDATLEELMHWDIAPENPARLARAGVRIALTTDRLSDPGTFLAQVRKAVERGLDKEDALRAVTTTPADLLGVAAEMGSIETGKAAYLIVTDGDLFEDDTKVMETWVDGRRYEVTAPEPLDVRGTWEVTLSRPDGEEQQLELALRGRPNRLAGDLSLGDKKAKLRNVDFEAGRLTAVVEGKSLDWDGIVRMSGAVTQSADAELNWTGSVLWADGSRTDASARRTSSEVPSEKDEKDDDDSDDQEDQDNSPEEDAEEEPEEEAESDSDPGEQPEEQQPDEGEKQVEEEEEKEQGEEDEDEQDAPEEEGEEQDDAEDADDDDEEGDDDEEDEDEDEDEPRRALYDVNYPLGAFGRSELPQQHEVVLLKGATVWTGGPQGTIEQADILIRSGKIAELGQGIEAPEGAEVVDATGMHISPGIIDCHSHIATDGGVNESAQAITAEVRIGDFIDSEDINIYRQLAGGVTASNILHGSANPIGGQNQVIKMRWGALPEQIKFAQAPPGIKFALGENVKQSNWGDGFNSRYPQSRMGVEQIMRDAFRAARAYQAQWDAWEQNRQGLPPRRDLELQTLSEILRGERWVHCHSYRQDEILALIRTADEFDFRIGTFQHILEGYKVATEMAEHGAMGSSFSDWWAYKFEVYDAIPYNGSLMHNAGVVVSFNSDDAELARRLNMEAGKAVKYGGVPPEEALKFVTLNPAKQLRIDKYTGSIEPGKDADLAIWNGPPMSSLARCEQTWVDGRKYFDREEDARMQREARAMHAALAQRILDEGAEMRRPGERDPMDAELWPRYDEFCAHHEHPHLEGEEHDE